MAPKEEAVGADIRSNALLVELQRVYGQLERNNDGPLSVIQFIVLALGAALIAAAEVPEAFVAVPVALTAWLLYSRLVDFNTMKLALYAEHLEQEFNAILSPPVFFWESRLATRLRDRPFIFLLNFGYWAAISAASWIAGVVVLFDQGRDAWAVVLAAIGTVLMVSVIRDYRLREATVARLRADIRQGPATPGPQS